MELRLDYLKKKLTVHHPERIHPDEQPNANIIYKIWDDGEVTYEKGGWAYGQRTPHGQDNDGPLFDPEIFSKLGVTFPEKLVKHNRTMGYAIVTKEQAYEIREAMGEVIIKLYEWPYEYDSLTHNYTTKKSQDRLEDHQSSVKYLRYRLSRDPVSSRPIYAFLDALASHQAMESH